jgi:hypothetical protein
MTMGWPLVYDLLRDQQRREWEQGKKVPGMWGDAEKSSFNQAMWRAKVSTSAWALRGMLTDYWCNQGVLDEDYIAEPDGTGDRLERNDKCPFCRTGLVPRKVDLAVLDAERACKELPMMLKCFWEMNAVRGPLPAGGKNTLESTIAVVLMTLHGRILLLKQVEEEVKRAVFEALDEMSWFRWTLLELRDPKTNRQFKLAVSMFVNFFTAHIMVDMPRVKIGI